MYKKIFVSLLGLILMFNFTFKDYTEAAIASKVAGQAAKQVAQEVIQDIAAETITNFALNQALDIVGEYEAKQGYKVVCPDGSMDCNKPIQVKENITDSDKQAIKGQAGSELDKLLNGGSGVPKWQKFLDWFMPIWLISFGATAITYAFDSDVRSLFNEAGYNALVALGFIIPVDTTTRIPLVEEEPNPADDADKINEDGNPLVDFASSTYTRSLNNVVEGSFDAQTTLISVQNKKNSGYFKTLDFYINGLFVNISAVDVQVESSFVGGSVDGLTLSAKEEGKDIFYDVPATVSTIGTDRYIMKNQGIQSFYNGGYPTTVVTRMPYEFDSKWRMDFVIGVNTGERIEYQMSFPDNPHLTGDLFKIESRFLFSGNASGESMLMVQPNKSPYNKILVPPFEEVAPQIPATIQKSNYEDGSGNVALIPPTALTYKEESTGETVYRVPAAVPTNPPVFQKEDGTPVPEEQITVGPAPTVTPAPNGSTTEKGEPIPQGTPTVTPAPTPSNPAPAPIPLTPTPAPTTPVEPPTTGDPPTTGEPIPEGPGCEEKFKFPILSPLKETFSTSFPFSIPWDIERAINAAFSGIGHEKPKFNLDLNVLGQKETIEITTPKMFDDWKPFTDTLLVLTFDVLIMFGVYRFVKGAGS